MRYLKDLAPDTQLEFDAVACGERAAEYIEVCNKLIDTIHERKQIIRLQRSVK